MCKKAQRAKVPKDSRKRKTFLIIEAVRFRVPTKGTGFPRYWVPFCSTLVKKNEILRRVPSSFSKMAAEECKSIVVRDILAFQLLADDDFDLILLANKGLKDLTCLGCERFAKT